jgi:hypothetical protein
VDFHNFIIPNGSRERARPVDKAAGIQISGQLKNPRQTEKYAISVTLILE